MIHHNHVCLFLKFHSYSVLNGLFQLIQDLPLPKPSLYSNHIPFLQLSWIFSLNHLGYMIIHQFFFFWLVDLFLLPNKYKHHWAKNFLRPLFHDEIHMYAHVHIIMEPWYTWFFSCYLGFESYQLLKVMDRVMPFWNTLTLFMLFFS